MGDIIIFCMTIIIITYLYYFLFKNRVFLSHYLTSTGGKKPKVYNVKPYVFATFVLIHIIIGVVIGISVFKNEIDRGNLIRVLVAVSTALFIVLLLWIIYFMIAIILKEIIAMNDKMINVILIYSIIALIILFYQIFNQSIEYPEAFVGASIIL